MTVTRTAGSFDFIPSFGKIVAGATDGSELALENMVGVVSEKDSRV